jgi:histidine triad (HIT) family protein
MVAVRVKRCVFCEIVQGKGPKGIVAYQDDTVAIFASRDQRPTNRGHMLVVTCEHYRNLYDLPEALYADVMTALCRTAEAVHETFNATGTTIRQNNEPPGQDVFHAHFHIVPRCSDEDLSARYDVVDLVTRIGQAQALKSVLAAQEHWS